MTVAHVTTTPMQIVTRTAASVAIVNDGPNICYLDSLPTFTASNADIALQPYDGCQWLPLTPCFALSAGTSTVRISKAIRL